MADTPVMELPYQRRQFVATLPVDRFYSPSHCWIHKEEDATFRVGFTAFITYLIGAVAELDFEVQPGDKLTLGAIVGGAEGDKDACDIHGLGHGHFIDANPLVIADPGLVSTDPHGRGWLYRFQGKLKDETLDVYAYAKLLDALIDELAGSEQTS